MYEQNFEDDEPTIETPTITVAMIKALGIDITAIQHAVTQGIQDAVMKQIKHDVQEQVALSVRNTVNASVNEWVKDFLEKPFTPVNHWGEPIEKESTTIRAVIEKKSKEFMLEKVDNKGEADRGGYSSTPRYMWAARQVAQEAIERSLRPELDKAISEMKNDVIAGINGVVSELVAKNFRKQQ